MRKHFLILLLLIVACAGGPTRSMFYTSEFQEVKKMKEDKRLKVLKVSRVVQSGSIRDDTLWAVEYIVP